MSPLSNIWTMVTDINRIDDDTTRVTLTDIGVDLDGTKFEFTGVGCTDGDIYEGVQFTATRVDDDNVDIDWEEHGYLAPDDDWVYGGMVRLYDSAISCADAMRISFNQENVASITSTGSTAAEYSKDNVMNSNRAMTHQLAAGDHTIVATLTEQALVETVALLDLTCSDDTTIRITGAAADGNVDVVYPAIAVRYSIEDRPKLGYEGITLSGRSENDPVPHFVAYVPPMLPTTVTVDIEGATGDFEFSELIICSFYEPQRAVNHNYGSQISHTIQGQYSQRGTYYTSLKYEGRKTELAFQLAWLDGYDRTYIDLITKSKRTLLVDLYPKGRAIRWEALTPGFVTSAIPVSQAETGGTTEISITDTKNYLGL